MIFNHLESLHWLWLVLAAVLCLAAGFRLRRRDLNRFAAAALARRLIAGAGPVRRWVRAALLVAALLLVVAGTLDPRWGVTIRQVRQRGVDIVVVLDISRSMLAQDVAPDRLGRARQFVSDLIDQLGGDRVALVTFAGSATLKCPLTIDHGAFGMALAEVTPESAPRGGSLLGDALRVAADAFTDQVPDHKVIIVFSDGEDQGSYPVEAARRLRQDLSIPVYTVGIGDSDEGARIPVDAGGRRVYLTYEGQEVWSKMNPTVLRDVALASGGAFVPVGTGTVDMGKIYQDRIEPVAKRQFDTAMLRRHKARFQWFAGLALVLLLAESFIGDGRRAA